MGQIDDLQIFAAVVMAGNMSAAGREMGLSPAVVSKRISHLENRLGARLFQRTTRQLALTEAGQGFYDRVVNVLAGIEEAEAFVSRRNALPSGRLKVSAPNSFTRRHIAPHLGNFFDSYPDMQVEMALSDTIVDIVGDGFDLAIRIAELQDSSLVAKKLAPCHRVICAAPSYLARHGEPADLAELAKHNCIVASHQEVWRLSGPDGAATVRVRGNVRTNSGEVIREAALAGVGIALRSTWDVGPELKSGDLKIVLPGYQESSRVAVYAVYPCRQFVPAKLRVFVDFLAGLYGPEPYWDKGLDLARAH